MCRLPVAGPPCCGIAVATHGNGHGPERMHGSGRWGIGQKAVSLSHAPMPDAPGAMRMHALMSVPNMICCYKSPIPQRPHRQRTRLA